MSFRRQAALLGVAVFAACGDAAIAHGMRFLGGISAANWTHVFAAIFTPWVAFGIALLIAFFASYLAALSVADLTYVLPATAFGYLLTALLGKYLLDEQIPLTRWAGIALIMAGVAFATSGPASTTKSEDQQEEESSLEASIAGRSVAGDD